MYASRTREKERERKRERESAVHWRVSDELHMPLHVLGYSCTKTGSGGRFYKGEPPMTIPRFPSPTYPYVQQIAVSLSLLYFAITPYEHQFFINMCGSA